MLENDHKDQRREKILDWISTSENESKHNAIRMPRVPGTGEWLLDTEEFTTWRMGEDSPSVLWCMYHRRSSPSLRVNAQILRHVLGVFVFDAGQRARVNS